MHPLQMLLSRRAGSAFAGCAGYITFYVNPALNRASTKGVVVATVVVVQVSSSSGSEISSSGANSGSSRWYS